MITLCGVAFSNFYNKVKLALLEKGIPFMEETAIPGQSPEVLAKSPMGKIPFIRTDHGYLSESGAIIEYIDAIGPKENRLMPADPWQSAQVRSIMSTIDQYIDGPIRRVLPAAFFGASTTPEEVAAAQQGVGRGMNALKRMVKFGPYLAGSELTYADTTAITIMPIVPMTLKAVGGTDPYADWPELQQYFAMMRQRPHVQKVEADSMASFQAMMASRK